MREGVCSEPSIVQARTVHMLQDYKSFPTQFVVVATNLQDRRNTPDSLGCLKSL